MYFVKTPRLVKKLFSSAVWDIETTRREIFLTFDDGPVPGVTPWVLETLKQYNARATFFCIGDNIRRYSEIFQEVVASGHAVGNHTCHHLNGWKAPLKKYLEDVNQCQELINQFAGTQQTAVRPFFRPPYGKIKPSQISHLKPHVSITMWSVLSGDFDTSISNEQCLRNVISNTGPGSIVVFHDSLKAEERLRYALPGMLEYFSEKGYIFLALR
jgi:peptidoglycan/xylan/chitin deacetylase (PgdA/CDA1 family)